MRRDDWDGERAKSALEIAVNGMESIAMWCRDPEARRALKELSRNVEHKLLGQPRGRRAGRQKVSSP